jgi:hypothetical protein
MINWNKTIYLYFILNSNTVSLDKHIALKLFSVYRLLLIFKKSFIPAHLQYHLN